MFRPSPLVPRPVPYPCYNQNALDPTVNDGGAKPCAPLSELIGGEGRRQMSGDETVIVVLKLGLATLLLCLSALFAAAETALLGVGKVKVRHFAEEGNEGAKKVLHLYRNPARLIATLLTGITLSQYLAEALVTSIAVHWEQRLALVGFSGAISVLFAVLVLTFVDVTPGIYGAASAETVALTCAQWVRFFQRLLSPFVWFAETVVNGLLHLFRWHDIRHPPLITEGELFAALEIAERQGILTREQRQMLCQRFGIQRGAGRRSDGALAWTWSPFDATRRLDEAIRLMRRSGHSRLPVYRDTRDEIVGILYAKDVLAAWYRGEREKTAGELARPPLFATETQRAIHLLRTMQRQRRGIAIVLDAEGGTAGLVTVEDVLEEIVGEIYDEYDIADLPVRQIGERTYLVRAPLSLRQVEKWLNVELPEEDYDTLAELLVAHLEHLPQVGDRVEVDGIVLEVAEMRGRRITWILVTVPSEGLADA
jgi:putative hemolysin